MSSPYSYKKLPEVADYTVIGAGIVGLATALSLQEREPEALIRVFEKAPDVAQEQTSHNSGVIHAGVYYKPGSLKAELCKKGNKWTKEFCETHGLPIEYTGKLIVATNELEEARLLKLHSNSIENSLEVSEILDREQLSLIEPNVRGSSAFLVKDTAITSYLEVSRKIASIFVERGGELYLAEEVTALKDRPEQGLVEIETSKTVGLNPYRSKKVISCVGIQSDRLAKAAGTDPFWSMIPFRGEYYKLPKALEKTVRYLIYPTPDPKLPFLGVHLTPMIDGSLTVGPNAVLGFSRTGYPKWSLSVRDVKDLLLTKGFYKVLKRQFRTGLEEQYRSIFKRAYLPLVTKYYSGRLSEKDFSKWPAGIRAQAVLKDSGELVEDFLFHEQGERILHCVNVPSPAATSAKPIGEYIADKVQARLPEAT